MKGENKMSGKKEIIGLNPVNYTRKNGTQCIGVNLYVVEPAAPPAIGMTCHEYFINGASMNEYKLGEYKAILFEPTRMGQARCVGVLYE